MTEKEKQITEMAKVLCGNYNEKYDQYICHRGHCDSNCMWYKSTETLYNAGYRKIDEGSVVLTQDEIYEFRKDQAEVKFLKKQIQEQTRKEMAKEIYTTGKYYYAKHSPTERQLSDFLAHIKETYGVVVE